MQGTVVAARDGSLVPAVTVRAIPAGGWDSSLNRSGASNAQGAYSITGLEPGAYTLVAEGNGWRGEAPAPLPIGLAQSIDHVAVAVSHATLVAGKVVLRKSGEACPSGSVTLGPTSSAMTSPYDSPSAVGETPVSAVPSMMAGIEAGGEVHFRSVPAGAYHVVVQCADRVLSEGPTTLHVGSTTVDGIVWSVEPGLGMVVHVTDEAGTPLPGARFALLWPARTPGGTRAAMPLAVDVGGQYRVPGVLFPGVYTLQPG
ncbi:MAG: carboxypeptidase-like regulatory domain-containing protein, partial [Polyangiaceae bacterium]